MLLVDQLSVRHYGASVGSHAHPHFQVLVGLQGELELEIEGRGQRVGAGDGCIVAPGARHDFESHNGCGCLVLDSSRGAWARCLSSKPPQQQVRLLAQYLAGVLATQPAHSYSLATSSGPLLLLEAWRSADPGYSAGRHIDWPSLSAWLAAGWHLPLAVADLAEHVHLSATQFTARCVAQTGMSPMQWVRQQRLAHARSLRAQGLSVAESARRTGYRSPSALTAALRRTSQNH